MWYRKQYRTPSVFLGIGIEFENLLPCQLNIYFLPYSTFPSIFKLRCLHALFFMCHHFIELLLLWRKQDRNIFHFPLSAPHLTHNPHCLSTN